MDKWSTDCQADFPCSGDRWLRNVASSSIGPSQIFTDLQVAQFPAFASFMMLVEYITNFRIGTYIISINNSPSTKLLFTELTNYTKSSSLNLKAEN